MNLHLLVSEQLQAGPAMSPPTPVSPEQGGGSNRERMQQHAHPTGLLGGLSMPLARLAQGTTSTLANASRIHKPQAAIGFRAVFRRREGLPSGATQGAIRLEHKVAPGEATLFEG